MASNPVRAFAHLKDVALDATGKCLLTYTATFVDTSKANKINTDTIVAVCDLKDSLSEFRSDILAAVQAKGKDLGFNVPLTGITAQDFFRG